MGSKSLDAWSVHVLVRAASSEAHLPADIGATNALLHSSSGGRWQQGLRAVHNLHGQFPRRRNDDGLQKLATQGANSLLLRSCGIWNAACMVTKSAFMQRTGIRRIAVQIVGADVSREV